MASKTHCKTSHKQAHGFTIVELLVVIAVIGLLTAALMLVMDPLNYIKKGRDNRRISDLSVLDRAVTEYKVDKGSYPDSSNTVRKSDVLPVGSTSLVKSSGGWIAANLSGYTVKLPIDPLNDLTYNYAYIHTAETYELNARLEIPSPESQNDGGTDANVYEIGNNLTLIP